MELAAIDAELAELANKALKPYIIFPLAAWVAFDSALGNSRATGKPAAGG